MVWQVEQIPQNPTRYLQIPAEYLTLLKLVSLYHNSIVAKKVITQATYCMHGLFTLVSSSANLFYVST